MTMSDRERQELNELHRRVAVLEERLRGIASSTTVLIEQNAKDIASIRGLLADVQRRTGDFVAESDIRDIRELVVRLEEREKGLRDEVTGRHKLSRTSILPPPHPREPNAAVELARVGGPIVLALIAIVASVVSYLLSHR